MNRKRILLIYYIILIIESKLINNNINKVYSLTKSKISSLNIQEIQQNKQNNENNLIIKLGKRIKDTIKSFYSPKKVQISSNLLISGMNRRNMRISQELKSFILDPPDNCQLVNDSNLKSWIVKLIGVNGTNYEGESFRLKFIFPIDYPVKPPIVYFLKPIPKHEHVYSNGDICLSTLGKDWQPTMTAQSIAIGILSMLSSAKEKRMPPDNAMHSDNLPGQQQENWLYHDEKC